MFPDVMNYKPAQNDYKFWLVVNPATWMMPILFALLLTALAVHAAVFEAAPKGMFLIDSAAIPAAAEAPAAEAPAPEAPAVAE